MRRWRRSYSIEIEIESILASVIVFNVHCSLHNSLFW